MDERQADQAQKSTHDSADVLEAGPETESFLHRPTVVVTLIGGVVGILAAIVGIVVGISGMSKSPGQDDADDRVNLCMDNHGLESEFDRNEGNTGILFRQCTWPAPAGAEADGYAEVAVTSYDGPGESEAEGLTVADYVRSSCRDVELVYVFDSMGNITQEDVVTVSKGEIRRVEGGSIWSPEDEAEASAFRPGRDESIIMSNHRYRLDSARCT